METSWKPRESIAPISSRPSETGESGELLDTIRKFTDNFKAVRHQIESMDDETLIALYQQAKEISNVSWLIRSIVIGTAKNRARRGDGIIKALAKEFGIGVRMAELDIQIYDNFIKSNPDFEPILPASFYTAALKAQDPESAIEYAIDKKAENPAYSAYEFKSYVGGDMPKEKAPPGTYMLVGVNPTELSLMKEENDTTALYAKISLISIGGSIYAEIK